jgi:hypothetical protein
MKGSLIALISTFLLLKAFLKTCITKSAHLGDKEMIFVESGREYNTTDTAKSVDSDVDGHCNEFSKMN